MDRVQFNQNVAELHGELERLIGAFCRARGLSFDPAAMTYSYVDLADVAREALVIGADAQPDRPASPVNGYKIGRANLGCLSA